VTVIKQTLQEQVIIKSAYTYAFTHFQPAKKSEKTGLMRFNCIGLTGNRIIANHWRSVDYEA